MTVETIIEKYIFEAKDKAFIGNISGKSYAVKIDSLERNDFAKEPFGRQMEALGKVRKFKEEAKTSHIDAKGKATLAAVKDWVKTHKPKEFYAQWTSDSSNYKDDSVEIYHK